MIDGDEETYIVAEAAPPPTTGARIRSFASVLAGAVLCVALVAGLGYWLVDLGEREAESLPVFQAAYAPAKVRPVDPGGIETPYQDIRSYDVAAGGTPREEVETTLAPPRETPAEEDVAMGDLPETRAPATPAPAPVAEGPVVRSEPEDPLAALNLPEADDLPGLATDISASRSASTEPAAATTPPVPARPAAEPASSNASSQQAIDEAARLAARAAVSRVQVQLGAFTDRSYTEAEWRRIEAANRDILGGKALAIQQTISGGKRYYRLRVGPFSDRSEAAGVCEALKARGHDCIVAVNS